MTGCGRKKCVVADSKRAYSVPRKAKAQKTRCPGLDRVPGIIRAPVALCNKPGQTQGGSYKRLRVGRGERDERGEKRERDTGKQNEQMEREETFQEEVHCFKKKGRRCPP